jgi:hypothetical protein
MNAHPIPVPPDYVQEFNMTIQNLIRKQNGMRNRCCDKQRVREENRAGWPETTAWAAVLEGQTRESGRQIAADDGQDLATAVGAIRPIKQNN